jgi:hypothetical protein
MAAIRIGLSLDRRSDQADRQDISLLPHHPSGINCAGTSCISQTVDFVAGIIILTVVPDSGFNLYWMGRVAAPGFYRRNY